MQSLQPAPSAVEIKPMRTRDLVLFFFGNVAPSIGIFLMLHGKVAEVTWQAGGLNSHASFLLSGVRLLILC